MNSNTNVSENASLYAINQTGEIVFFFFWGLAETITIKSFILCLMKKKNKSDFFNIFVFGIMKCAKYMKKKGKVVYYIVIFHFVKNTMAYCISTLTLQNKLFTI